MAKDREAFGGTTSEKKKKSFKLNPKWYRFLFSKELQRNRKYYGKTGLDLKSVLWLPRAQAKRSASSYLDINL